MYLALLTLYFKNSKQNLHDSNDTTSPDDIIIIETDNQNKLHTMLFKQHTNGDYNEYVPDSVDIANILNISSMKIIEWV